MQTIVIKKAREGVLRRKHPWIFSGALAPLPPALQAGDICKVTSAQGAVLGYAFVNPRTDLCCRMLSFNREFNPATFIEERLSAAWQERQELVPSTLSTAFRLCNAEGDGLPGLVVDCYGDAAVLQISTMGMERCKERVVAALISRGITRIYEKSRGSARTLEGLPLEASGCLHGDTGESDPLAIISEHGLDYEVPLLSGQKTGFFLDQRDMRLFLRGLSPGKKVLNCFAYSGGFSFNALIAGATSVVSVDSSAAACEAMARNTLRNPHVDASRHRIVADDVLRFLRGTNEKFDLIVLDPPPYVKKAKDVKRGFAHYQELNQLGMEHLSKGGVLCTFSCSPFFGEEDWERMLAAAMMASGRSLRILGQHRHALDHPVALAHSEGRYLKGSIIKEYPHD